MAHKPLVFLTGGRGMVGSNILEHPLAIQYEWVVPHSSEVDLRNANQVREVIQKCRPEYVIHAAGRVGGIQANIANPVDFLVDNVDMGRNVILAARDFGVKKLLNLASSCMYPRDAPNPLDETLILKGELEATNEGYALAKIYTTRLCQYVAKEDSSLLYKTLIPCNLYGRFDKFDPKFSHLIPAIIHKIHMAKTHGAATVDIWGDGFARREFMYAGDLAELIFKSLNSFDTLPDLINVGLGFDHTINEYYQVVSKIIGWQGTFTHDLDKPVGMRQKLVSTELLNNWGWSSKTSLETGIKYAYDFYLESKL